jgi:hypothetical protein
MRLSRRPKLRLRVGLIITLERVDTKTPREEHFAELVQLGRLKLD